MGTPMNAKPGSPDWYQLGSGGGVSWQVHLCVLLLTLSGFAALLYELVWFQQVELVIGSSAASLGILLSVYMGGMFAGSILLPRLVPASAPPFRVYAAIELGVAVCAALLWLELPLLNRVYAVIGGQGASGLVLRGILCAICLLPPTILMGAALPALSRWVKSTSSGVSTIGLLYASNTVGAVAGCLLAGFYLMRVHDMASTVALAMAVNVLLAGVSYLVPLKLQGKGREPILPAEPLPPAFGATSAHVVIFLSGLSAFGGEVVWTRLLALLLGATVYTFSIILAVFLAGIAIGGWVGAQLVRTSTRPLRDLGMVQALLALAIAWATFVINQSLPFWPIAPALSENPWNNFQLDLIRCLWALMPAALLWGASMPYAMAAASRGQDAGELVATVYAANTIGAVAGALLFTFVLVPGFGTQGAQRFMIVVALIASATAVAPLLSNAAQDLRRTGTVAAVAVVMLFGIAQVGRVAPVNGEVLAFGRSLAYRMGLQDPRTGSRVPLPRILYAGEGINESIAVSDDGRVRLFHVSGKIEASTAPKDMKLQRLLGLVPAVTHPEPKSVLIVGFGAGVTSGTFIDCPSVKRIVICELEPLIPKKIGPFFAEANHHIVDDPRVQLVYDDARHFMLTTKEKFDIITSDPIHPWVKGSAVLYSKEYFRLVREHLNPGGVATQWVPLYQSSESTIRGEIATFMNVFPEGTVWANLENEQGYDLVLMGGTEPPRITLDDVASRLARPDHARLVASMREVGFGTWSDLLYTYAGRGRDLQPWLAGSFLNEDKSLRLQFQAGMESLVEQEADIYAEMHKYRSFPTDLFVGSPALVNEMMVKGN